MKTANQIKTHLYKSCPRCKGDLFADSESLAEARSAADVSYVCLQCGRSTTFSQLRGGLQQVLVPSREVQPAA